MLRARVHRRGWTTAGVLATVLLAAACGSSTKSSSGGSTSAGSSSIKVMYINTSASTIAGFPEQADSAKAQVAMINAAGGVNGHQVDLAVCNDQANPNSGASCAQKAVSSGVVAVVGGISLGSSGIIPVLEQAGIADISNPTSPLELTSSISWPPVGGTPPQYAGLAEAMVKQYGCTKVDSISASNVQAQATVGQEKAGLAAIGSSLHAAITTPAVNTDYAPTVAQVASDGADCALLNFPANENVKAIPAFRQGAPKVKLGTSANSLPLSVVAALGSAANGVVLSDQNFPVTSTGDGVKAFNAAMSKAYPKDPADAAALEAWGAMTIFEQAAKSAQGDINAKSVTAALGALSNADSTVGPPISYTASNGLKGYNRVFNTKVLTYTVANGTFSYDASQTPIDTLSALKILAGS
jgi:branched-chain amino acid transport system substrate-binding protein